MLKNNNQVAVNRIYQRMLKQNKIRNRIIILAIILTTFMFTAVFTLGFSMAKNLNQMQLRLQGTKASVFLENPTNEQIEEVKKCEGLNAAGLQIDAGVAYDKNGQFEVLLQYYDNTEFQKNTIPAVEGLVGKYPEKENEIMISKKTLENMGINEPVKNQNISLNVGDVKQDFVLSGWFTYYGKGDLCLVSKAYVDKGGYNAESNGRISMSSKEGKQTAFRENLEEKLTLKEGQDLDVNYDVREENASNRIVIAISIFLIALMIVLSGYLLIFNVMYISVTKDIRFYGMLKTLGTSPSQIRLIVKKQAKHLTLIGIPVGIIIGTVVSFGAVPIAMDAFSVNRYSALSSAVSFNPGIYIFSTLFAFVTVVISANKPAKLAGKVSAIDAMKYNGIEKVRAHKTTSGGKLSRMAWRNVFREKKRAFLVFASIFMGTMTFLCINTFIKCLDADSYIEHYLHDDYVIYGGGDTSVNYKKTMKDIALEVSQIEGMDTVYVNRSAKVNLPFDASLYEPFFEGQECPEEMIQFYSNPTDERGEYSAPMISVDTERIEEYNKNARQKVDIDAFERGEICLIGYLQSESGSEKMLGKTLVLKNKNTNQEHKVEVGAALLRNEEITAGYYWFLSGAPEMVIVSEKVMDELFPDADVDCIIANAKPGKEPDVTPYVQEIDRNNSIINATDIRSVEGKEFKKSMLSLEILGGGISLILILIGVVNYANVMITGVYTRRMELAVLESVGMTKKQIRKMLMYEGMFYGIITLGLVLTIGNAMIYGTGQLCMSIADYAILHFPIAKMIGILAIIFVMCIVVPAIVFKTISKDTVTERLRAVV